MRAQVAARAIGGLVGLQGSINPLRGCPTFQSIADIGHDALVARLEEPDVRAAIIAELAEHQSALIADAGKAYVLGAEPDYEPDSAASLAGTAARAGVSLAECLYDVLLTDGGRGMVYVPVLNYVDGNLDAVGEMLADPNAVPGLSDGGAHVGMICDGSFPTTLITHWARDRRRGPRFELPWLISRQTRATAETVGLLDRGMLAPGLRADINVIDVEALKLGSPELAFDLPAGGKRFLQRAHGYRHTFVAGVETYVDGEPTGALPGRLVRGGR